MSISPSKNKRYILNNQPDALIIPILFCYKTVHVSGIFCAHHQEFSTVYSTLVSFMQVSDDHFQAESGRNILTLIGYGFRQRCIVMDATCFGTCSPTKVKNLYRFGELICLPLCRREGAAKMLRILETACDRH